MKYICNVSGGLCSFWAWFRAVERYGRENVLPLFADVLIEDDELYRGFVNVGGDLAQLFESLALGLFYGRAGGDGGEIVVTVIGAVVIEVISAIVNEVVVAVISAIVNEIVVCEVRAGLHPHEEVHLASFLGPVELVQPGLEAAMTAGRWRAEAHARGYHLGLAVALIAAAALATDAVVLTRNVRDFALTPVRVETY